MEAEKGSEADPFSNVRSLIQHGADEQSIDKSIKVLLEQVNNDPAVTNERVHTEKPPTKGKDVAFLFCGKFKKQHGIDIGGRNSATTIDGLTCARGTVTDGMTCVRYRHEKFDKLKDVKFYHWQLSKKDKKRKNSSPSSVEEEPQTAKAKFRRPSNVIVARWLKELPYETIAELVPGISDEVLESFIQNVQVMRPGSLDALTNPEPAPDPPELQTTTVSVPHQASEGLQFSVWRAPLTTNEQPSDFDSESFDELFNNPQLFRLAMITVLDVTALSFHIVFGVGRLHVA